MFWQRLGWPESKPEEKKFWTILTKGDGRPSAQRSFLLFEVIVGFSVPSTILADFLRNTCLLERVQIVVGCDWWISIRFVCFCVSVGSLLLTVQFGAIIDLFASKMFADLSSYSWGSLARIKQCLPNSIDKNSTNHAWRFPSLFLISLESFAVLSLRPSWAIALYCNLHYM